VTSDDKLTGAQLGTWLVDEARRMGFDDAGLAPVTGPIADAAHFDDAVASGRMEPFRWLADTLDQRRDVRVRVAGARTVLVVVQSYFAGHHDEHASADELAHGARVARYAWGSDYHNVQRRKLRKLRARLLQKSAAAARVAPFGDVDAVADRAWAKAAGLGFTGKSGMFISRKLGTWTFLGGLITDLDLGATPALPPTDLCGTCTACIDACPTAAITAPGVVDARRCLVTWNVEAVEDPRGDAADMRGHGWAVGCDVCQEVCPWNRFESPTTEPRLAARAGHVVLARDAALDDVAGTPLARPGREALPRLVARALDGARPPVTRLPRGKNR
jgi:epoxyqueuosine reductase